jgi:hypothetical protein
VTEIVTEMLIVIEIEEENEEDKSISVVGAGDQGANQSQTFLMTSSAN